MQSNQALAAMLGNIATQLSNAPGAQAMVSQMVSGIAGGGGGANFGGGGGGGIGGFGGKMQVRRGPEPSGPIPTPDDFIMQNGLEDWCLEALQLLDDRQKAHVMGNPLNLDHTRNLDGVLTSRIKEVASTEQRLQMFIQINGLDPGVVDRLSTLTPDQHEKVMESTLKIAKANNPSGVCMRRITDVLKSERLGMEYGKHMSAPDSFSCERERERTSAFGQGQGCSGGGGNSIQAALTNLVDVLQGGRSRSRSPPRGSSASTGVRDPLPRAVEDFVSNNGLEWWVGQVLARLSLLQRQNVMTELGNMAGIRNPSGVVMARVKQTVSTQEMLAIFIDINQLDPSVSSELWALSEEHQKGVMGPGIFIQAARNPSTIAKTRMRNVLDGRDAMGGPKRDYD